jgi:hypothetical protein
MKTNLKEKFDNGVKFVKDHKKEILIGTGAVIAAVVTGKVINNKMETCAEVGFIAGLDIGVDAVCKQQNLNVKDVVNNELMGIMKDFVEDEEGLNGRIDMAIKMVKEMK